MQFKCDFAPPEHLFLTANYGAHYGRSENFSDGFRNICDINVTFVTNVNTFGHRLYVRIGCSQH